MKIIGLGYKARVGKDSAGAFLVEKCGFKRYAFADALKLQVSHILGIDLKSETNKIAFRKFLIAYGEAKRQLHPDCWLKIVQEKMADDNLYSQKVKLAVITDVRYKNEAEWIRSQGGLVIRIDRQTGLDIEEEHELDDFQFDYVIDNNGTFEELYDQLTNILIKEE